MYFFILGHSPIISISEITSVLEKKGLKITILGLSKEILLLQTDKEIEVKNLIRELGGTIKIGAISQTYADLTQTNADLLLKELPASGRVYFGFSVYKLEENVYLKEVFSLLKKLAMTIKKMLSQQGISSRWVTSKERTLSSVVVEKNKLLEKGAEIVFLVGKEKIYLGKTLAVQEFEEYSYRDYQRPNRDIISGMMPPKLAKIMINLGQADKEAVILDPFCGCGTIIQEAILLGYQNIIGCDNSEEAIKASQENIKWLLEKSKIKNQNSKLQIKIQKWNTEYLSHDLGKEVINVIISEPYLGPVRFSDREIPKIVKELSQFYLQVFKEFRKVLKPKGRIVFIFPVFLSQNKFYFLPIIEEIKKMGFAIINPISQELENNSFIETTNRGSMIYSRPDQKVLREIFIFKNL